LIVVLCGCTPGNSGENKSGGYTIKNAANEELAIIGITDNEIAVKDTEMQLVGVAKRSDKRKYYNASNQMVYAVKLDDDGFKLRNENEELIWKIKLYDDKLKIANNEEMTDALEIKLRDQGKLKLEKNDKELKSIRLSEGLGEYEIESRYKISGFGVSLAAGILLLDDLKEREKFIIMAELVKRGR
jgi:hypothetical protein